MTITLSKFLDDYINHRTDVKPSTRTNLNVVRMRLPAYFGADRQLDSITEGDADEWRRWLATDVKNGSRTVHRKLAENTIRRACSRGRQFFRFAVRKRYIEANPFADMKRMTVGCNEERLYFVSAEESAKVLAACPLAEWRVIFSLCRWGGLRCPSEVLSLRWEGVDFERSRMRVDSPKTEHNEGGAYRIVPMFPEVRRELEAVHEPGLSGYVIDERRRNNAMRLHGWNNCNLRTQFREIVWRSGCRPWPKLFQNLRSTRETELCDRFPVHVVVKWLGNSTLIARKHYLQTTDAHFQAAVAGEGGVN